MDLLDNLASTESYPDALKKYGESPKALHWTNYRSTAVRFRELVADLDEVLKLDGLDSLVLGPQDLSGSMGRLGETTHPDVVQVMKTVAAKARAAGKFVGSGLGANKEFARLLIDCGVQWLQAGNDFEYMIRGCERTFGEIRGESPARSARDSYGQRT